MPIQVHTADELEITIHNEIKKTLEQLLPEYLSKQQKPTFKPFLNRKEVLDLLNVSAPTLQRMRNERRIPFVQDGRKILYPYEGIMQYMERHHIKSK